MSKHAGLLPATLALLSTGCGLPHEFACPFSSRGSGYHDPSWQPALPTKLAASTSFSATIRSLPFMRPSLQALSIVSAAVEIHFFCVWAPPQNRTALHTPQVFEQL